MKNGHQLECGTLRRNKTKIIGISIIGIIGIIPFHAQYTTRIDITTQLHFSHCVKIDIFLSLTLLINCKLISVSLLLGIIKY